MGIGAGVIEGRFERDSPEQYRRGRRGHAPFGRRQGQPARRVGRDFGANLADWPTPYAGAISGEQRLQVLKLRLAASELACARRSRPPLHAGAKGYHAPRSPTPHPRGNVRRHRHTGDQTPAQGNPCAGASVKITCRNCVGAGIMSAAPILQAHDIALPRAAQSGIQPRVTGFFAGFGAW